MYIIGSYSFSMILIGYFLLFIEWFEFDTSKLTRLIKKEHLWTEALYTSSKYRYDILIKVNSFS